MTDYLDLDDVVALAREFLGDPPPIRDLGLLASAIGRPAATAFGIDAYPDLWTKAAALMQSLVVNHALIDGNKRLGWSARSPSSASTACPSHTSTSTPPRRWCSTSPQGALAMSTRSPIGYARSFKPHRTRAHGSAWTAEAGQSTSPTAVLQSVRCDPRRRPKL